MESILLNHDEKYSRGKKSLAIKALKKHSDDLSSSIARGRAKYR